MEIKLKTDFIELDNLLKAMELVSCGPEAKEEILKGRVKVNGLVETRVRKKIRAGDFVEFGEEEITIIGQGGQ